MKSESVSKADVAWHLDHVLKTFIEVTKFLENSNPKEFKSGFNAAHVMSLTFGFIPRGKAQSPAAVRPPENIKTENIISQLEKAISNLKVLNSLDKTFILHILCME